MIRKELSMARIEQLNSTFFSKKELTAIYDAVFRESTHSPGFYFQDFGKQIDSNSFRQRMVELKIGLSTICEQTNKQLNYQSVGRFNHQHSSRFHRDSTEEAHSFLMLGYEPTSVDSKVYVADYSKLIENQHIDLETYLEGKQDVNSDKNDHMLMPYITEISPFPKDHYRILFLNNNQSFEEKTFGVFHRAEVAQTTKGDARIINYMMLYLCDKGVQEYHSSQVITNFICQDKVFH